MINFQWSASTYEKRLILSSFNEGGLANSSYKNINTVQEVRKVLEGTI